MCARQETIQISPNGKYKASISSGSNDSKLSLSVENGDAGVKAFAGIELKF